MRVAHQSASISFCVDLTDPEMVSIPIAHLLVASAEQDRFAVIAALAPKNPKATFDPITDLLSDATTLIRGYVDRVLAGLAPGASLKLILAGERMNFRASKVLTVWALCLAVVAGSGCEESGSSLPDAAGGSPDAATADGGTHPRDYGFQVAGAYCGWLRRCNEYLFAASGGSAECIANSLKFWDGVVEYRALMPNAERAPPVEAQVMQCVARLAAADCSTSLTTVAGTCPSLAVGFVEVGGRCGGRGECVEGTECFASEGERCGSCEELPSAGDRCGRGLCKEPFSCFDGLCRKNGKPGNRCEVYDCDPLYECGDAGLCQARTLDQLGDPCSLYCDREAFLVCSDNSCVEGLSFVGTNAPCDKFHLCSGDLECQGGVCTPAPAPGESCPMFVCNSDGRCDPGTQVCVALGAEDAPCDDDFQCSQRLRCLGGQCRPWSFCE